jgi:hypothetical protein
VGFYEGQKQYPVIYVQNYVLASRQHLSMGVDLLVLGKLKQGNPMKIFFAFFLPLSILNYISFTPRKEVQRMSGEIKVREGPLIHILLLKSIMTPEFHRAKIRLVPYSLSPNNRRGAFDPIWMSRTGS